MRIRDAFASAGQPPTDTDTSTVDAMLRVHGERIGADGVYTAAQVAVMLRCAHQLLPFELHAGAAAKWHADVAC